MDSGTNKRVMLLTSALVIALVVIVALAWPKGPANGPANTNTPAANTNVGMEPSPITEDPEPAAMTGTYVNSTAEDITLASVSAMTATNLTLVGEAEGPWYFEASFPVEVYDNANVLIGSGIAQAQSDWMTVSMVPFIANVTLNAPYSGPAVIVLKKDNPSGEPANDASVGYNVTL